MEKTKMTQHEKEFMSEDI